MVQHPMKLSPRLTPRAVIETADDERPRPARLLSLTGRDPCRSLTTSCHLSLAPSANVGLRGSDTDH
jgi:hypothetical protein